QKKESAKKFGQSGDPGDWLAMHGVKSETKRGPEGERRRLQGNEKDVDSHNHGGIQKNVDEMPRQRVGAPQMILDRVNDGLQGAIIVGSVDRAFPGGTGEGPDVARKGETEVLGLQDQGVLQDLDAVVGDEAVAERGGVKSDGNENQNDEMVV